MEHLSNSLNQTSSHSNSLRITSSESTAATEREITAAEEFGLFTIINQVRALQGWSLATASELEPICKVWWREFARYNIPPEHYEALYRRAHDRRMRAINEGAKNIPPIDASTLIAGWIGEYGLKAELHQKRIAEGRYLEANAASDCEMCHGGGMRFKENPVEPSKSGYVRCDHGNE